MATYTWSKKSKYFQPLCINSLSSEDADRDECDLICMTPWDGGIYGEGNGFGGCSRVSCSDFYDSIRRWDIQSEFTDTTANFPFTEANGPQDDGTSNNYSTYWRDGLNPVDIRPTSVFHTTTAPNQFCYKVSNSIPCEWVSGLVRFYTSTDNGLAVPAGTCTDANEWHDREFNFATLLLEHQVPVLSTVANRTFNCTDPDFGSEYYLRDNYEDGSVSKWGSSYAGSEPAFPYPDPPMIHSWPSGAAYGDAADEQITDTNIAAYEINDGQDRVAVSADCGSSGSNNYDEYDLFHAYRGWYLVLTTYSSTGSGAHDKWRATLNIFGGGSELVTYHRKYNKVSGNMTLTGSAYSGNEESGYAGDTASVPTTTVWEGDVDCDTPHVISLDRVSGDAGGHFPDPLILKAIET